MREGDDTAGLPLAVGWLGAGHDYATGRVSPHDRARLEQLLVRRCGLVDEFMGFHTCEVCWNHSCHGSVFVPGEGVVFIAPEGIAHYIDEHHYLPPTVFLDAVRRCPPMSTDAYFAALAATGGCFSYFAGKTALDILGEPLHCRYCGNEVRSLRVRVCPRCGGETPVVWPEEG
jgi:hypothetical protein